MVWFREDLRLNDHLALANAAKKCHDGLICVYLLDKAMWRKHHMAACRMDFILHGLQHLKNELTHLNIPLMIKEINSKTIPQEIYRLIEQYNVKALYFNKQYEIHEWERDEKVIHFLATKNISVFTFDDTVILPPGSITTKQGDYFKVFTAFKNTWYQYFENEKPILLKHPKKQNSLNIKSSEIPFDLKPENTLWPSGEKVALKRLKKFIQANLFLYDKQRDFPAIEGTSKLSPYLSAGMISPRQCFLAAFDANHQELDTGNKGAVTWMIELIWRDFYKHLLVAVPKLSKHRAFKPETEKIKWHFDEKKLRAWHEGQTGIPIIDAAMRQLNKTGWMHNRLRMIVAMFFSKNLFFDWRLGEDYFIRHLMDGDLAANNGGWQWSASTGTDAAPYFRIFNPIRQSERFDPKGLFIRKYCPELKKFDDYAIHAPHERMPLLAKQVNYPLPIVNLEISRKKAIEAFKNI